MPTNDTDSFRALFLRHDLMVELDVIDGAIQRVSATTNAGWSRSAIDVDRGWSIGPAGSTIVSGLEGEAPNHAP